MLKYGVQNYFVQKWKLIKFVSTSPKWQDEKIQGRKEYIFKKDKSKLWWYICKWNFRARICCENEISYNVRDCEYKLKRKAHDKQ